jgi:hypothetical protein
MMQNEAINRKRRDLRRIHFGEIFDNRENSIDDLFFGEMIVV